MAWQDTGTLAYKRPQRNDFLQSPDGEVSLNSLMYNHPKS